MVNKINVADLGALTFMKGMDGITVGMWLQIQNIISNQLGSKEEIDHAELSKLVKNILDTSVKVESKGGKFSPLINFLPTLAKLTPEMVTLIKQEVGKQPIVSLKSQDNPALIQKTSMPSCPTFREPPLLRPEDSAIKTQYVSLLQPMQQMIKEVLQALRFLLPNLEKKGGEKVTIEKSVVVTPSLFRPTREISGGEFMENVHHLDNQALQQEKKVLSKSDNTLRKEVHSVEKRASFERDEPISQLKEKGIHRQLEIDKRAPLPIPRKELPMEQAVGSRSVSQLQPGHLPQQAERTLIPGAPYPIQFAVSDLRRKEKKKYPYYHSDREEGEEDSENNDPNKK